MIPPVYSLLKAANITALGSPLRVFAFGEADQKSSYPYVTWQVIGGSPDNFLGELPDTDDYSVQIDVWALKAETPSDSVMVVATAVRDALEGSAYMTDRGNTERDPDTGCYRYRMTFEFYQAR